MAEEGKNEVPEDEVNMLIDAASDETGRLLHSVAEYPSDIRYPVQKSRRVRPCQLIKGEQIQGNRARVLLCNRAR